jgi:hypothetical protein
MSTATLPAAITGRSTMVSLSKIPLSIRMWEHSDWDTGEYKVRFDIPIEANVSAGGRSRSVRINGS